MALMLMSTVWARDKRITLAEGLLGWAHHACCSLCSICLMISTVLVGDSDRLLGRRLGWLAAVCTCCLCLSPAMSSDIAD